MSSRITPPSADTDSTSRRRLTFVIAAIVLVVIVICAIFVLVNGGDDKNSAPPPAPQPTGVTPSGSQSTQEPTPTTSAPNRCSLRAGNQTAPATPIHGASWSLVNRVAVPSADSFGPQITDPDGLRRCFAHSPTGAVFAMYNHLAAMSPPDDTTGDKTFAVLRRIMTSGPDRDRYFDYLKTAEDTGSGDVSAQLAGFKVLDATTDRVTMLIALQAAGGYASSTWTLMWSGTDWLVVAPKAGERAGDPYTTLTDLTGFVPWRGA
jgi:hypothetical protein